MMKRSRKYLIESFEEEWTCPITSMPMIDPVLTLDGHSYQKGSIIDWLKKKNTSPKTGLSLENSNLIPNLVLKNVIIKFQNEFKYEFEKISTENTQLNDKLQKFDDELKKIKKEKAKAQNQFNQMKSKYSELLTNSKKVGESFMQSKKEIETLKTENQELKKQKASLKVEIKSVEAMKGENKIFKEESQKLKKDNQFYQIQNQNLIKQRIESMNSESTLKNELTAVKNQNNTTKKQIEELRSLLTKKTNQCNIAEAKVMELELAKQKLNMITLKHQEAVEQINNLKAGQKKINQAKKNSLFDNTKDSDLQKLKLQTSRYRIENANLKNQIKQAVAQLDKLKLDHERLKHIHNLSIKSNEEKNINAAPKISNVFLPKQIQKIEEEKPQKGIGLPYRPNQSKKIEQPSEKKLYEPSRPWKAPDLKKKEQASPINKILNLFKRQTNSSKTPDMKPAPLLNVNPSPVGESFRDLLKQSMSQKMQIIQEKSNIIKRILPYQDYLLTNPVLYDEQKHDLDHSGCKINIDEFLKHNWSELKTLNLSESQLDDRGFQLLTNEAIYFDSLNHLWLWNNYIVNVPKFALDRFKNLKTTYFSIKGRHANPLSQQSKQYLSIFAKKNPFIHLTYQDKPV